MELLEKKEKKNKDYMIVKVYLIMIFMISLNVYEMIK